MNLDQLVQLRELDDRHEIVADVGDAGAAVLLSHDRVQRDQHAEGGR